MSEQTAVEYIEEYLRFKGLIINDKKMPQVLIGVIKFAKQMEKEQIKDAYETSHISMMTAEQYYDEKFNKDEKTND